MYCVCFGMYLILHLQIRKQDWTQLRNWFAGERRCLRGSTVMYLLLEYPCLLVLLNHQQFGTLNAIELSELLKHR